MLSREPEIITYPHFTAEKIAPIEHGPGIWNSLRIGVFQQDAEGAEKKMIGEYVRNYSTMYNTFCAFEKNGRHFALYSPNYTCTRIMEIFPGAGIKDIGGEDPHSDGFCPTDFYVPQINEWVSEAYDSGPGHKIKDWSRLLEYFPKGTTISEMSKGKAKKKLCYPDGKAIRAYDESGNYKWVFGPEQEYEYGFVNIPPQHAFVAGCHWGDDRSWKIQYIDLSHVEDGIIARYEKFGYIEIPENISLRDAIHIDDLSETGRLTISIALTFDLQTGNPLIYEDSLIEKIENGRNWIKLQDQRAKLWVNTDEELKTRWAEQKTEIEEAVRKAGGAIG